MTVSAPPRHHRSSPSDRITIGFSSSGDRPSAIASTSGDARVRCGPRHGSPRRPCAEPSPRARPLLRGDQRRRPVDHARHRRSPDRQCPRRGPPPRALAGDPRAARQGQSQQSRRAVCARAGDGPAAARGGAGGAGRRRRGSHRRWDVPQHQPTSPNLDRSPTIGPKAEAVFRRIDVQTGEVTVLLDLSERGKKVHSPNVSPDGKTLFYGEYEAGLGRVMRRTLENGDEKELYRLAERVGVVSPSLSWVPHAPRGVRAGGPYRKLLGR